MSVPQRRCGIGYDSHRFGGDGPLILGGVEIPGERALKGHSDADVVAHAVTDALLGAAGLGDIGEHFPDDDPRLAGADSIGLLRRGARGPRGARLARGQRRHNRARRASPPGGVQGADGGAGWRAPSGSTRAQ